MCTFGFLTCLVTSAFILNLVASAPRNERAVQDYRCPRSNGLFADPQTCKRFYMCSENYPYVQRCPPSLYFDDIKKHCTHKGKDLTCGPVDLEPEVVTTPDPLAALKCDPAACQLPECFCSSDGTGIPQRFDLEDTPQMIMLSFDGALHERNSDNYHSVLNETRKNPNGCPIKGTFFVPHEYTSYYSVERMYADGHEIAINSISSREPETWWEKASYENWTEEIVGMREILNRFANVSRDSIHGMRAPFIKAGGNNMMSMIYEYGLSYDSSIPAPVSRVPYWPYTLDYRMPHKCMNNNCPTRSFPGVWEIPLNMMHSEDGSGGSCALMDQCVFPLEKDQVYDFLMENFLRHYKTNRAPMGLFFHINWFSEPIKVAALQEFIDDILADYKDAYFVTIQQALAWMREPTKLETPNSYKPWACETREPTCQLPKTCLLPFSEKEIEDVRYMQTCSLCPNRYPWVGNFEGAVKGHSITELTKDAPDNSAEEVVEEVADDI